MKRFRFAVLVLAATLLAVGAYAQTTGTIEGTITDQTRASLPGVTVEANSPALPSAKVVTSDMNGKFRFTLLPVGTYSVRFTLEGFATQEQANIGVSEGRTVTLQVQMRGAFKEEVVVTGSLIPRPTLEAMSPVATMDVEELAYQGTTRLEDLLTSLPQVFHAQNSTISNGASGTATVDLRYMGAVRTLVLLDGRRLPSGDPGAVSPDLNFIPAGLVKRVDVLTGGASSTYGADAVSGVVNFIIDRDLTGMKVSFTGGGYEHDNNNALEQSMNQAKGFSYPKGQAWDGGNLDAFAAWGGNFADGRGHVTMYLDYRKTAADLKARRDYLNCSNLDGFGGAAASPYCGGSGTIPNGRFRVYDPSTYAKLGDYTIDSTTGNTFRNRVGTDIFNYAPYNYMQRPDERWAGGGFLNYEWNKHFQAYVDLMLMDDESDAQIAPSGDFGSVYEYVNCNNPMLSAQQQAKLCVKPVTSGQYAGDAFVLINKRGVEGGGRDDVLNHTSYRLLAGLKGEINKQWSYDVYGLNAETRKSEIYLHDYSYDKIQDALLVSGTPGQPSTWQCISGNTGCAPWNIFTLGGVTQAALNYVQIPLLAESLMTTRLVSGKVVGDLKDYGIAFPSAIEGISLALGAEYRKEYLSYQPDQSYIDGLGAGQGAAPAPVVGNYSVKEAFTEINIPIVQGQRGARNLVLNLGYRTSDYNVNGEQPTWKIEGTWAPTDDFKFRAGLNHAVRAPNINDLYSPSGVAIGDVTGDPCSGAHPIYTAAQCAFLGVSAAQYGHIDGNPAGQYNTRTGGNPALNPEKADTKSFGIVITPQGSGFTATLDYFDIDIKGAISTLPGNSIITQCATTGDPTMCSLIHRDTAGSLWMLQTAYVNEASGNYGDLREKGVDVNLGYTFHIGKGALNLNLVGTYVNSHSWKDPFISYDCAGYFGNTCGDPLPKWRHMFRATWDTGAYNVSLAWRYLGAVTVDEANPAPSLYTPADFPSLIGYGSYKIPAYNWFDLAFTLKFTRSIQWMVGVNNIADKEPPLGVGFSPNDYGPGFHGSYDPYGRYIHSSLTFTF